MSDCKVPSQWVSEPELCQILQYSSSTVRRLRAKGLPCVGNYRLRRYQLAQVIDWIAKHG